jgi:flagellar basal body-associated protein FliL
MLELFKLKFGKTNAADERETADNLRFLEDVLSEEDPEFMQSVGKMEIDNTAVDESVAKESALRTSAANAKNFYASLFNSKIMQSSLFKTVMIHKYPKQAITFWLVVGGVGYGANRLYRAHFWKESTPLFLTSYADLSLAPQDYDMLEDVEPYYDNVRFSKNIMSLVKMTANIRPSANSTSNPMISLEIVIQGVSNEPIVEIKDREAEFRDLILRVIEDFNYDDLETSAGKQQLSEAILAKINSNLTDGQIRKVFYKNFVIKP